MQGVRGWHGMRHAVCDPVCATHTHIDTHTHTHTSDLIMLRHCTYTNVRAKEPTDTHAHAATLTRADICLDPGRVVLALACLPDALRSSFAAVSPPLDSASGGPGADAAAAVPDAGGSSAPRAAASITPAAAAASSPMSAGSSSVVVSGAWSCSLALIAALYSSKLSTPS